MTGLYTVFRSPARARPRRHRLPPPQQLLEIHEPRRILMRHDQAGHDFTMTIELDAVEGTALTWVLRFDDLAEAERLRAIILGANEQKFDRLEALLAAG